MTPEDVLLSLVSQASAAIFDSWNGSQAICQLAGREVVIYRARRDDRTCEAAPDWWDEDKRRDIVAEIVNSIREIGHVN
jgi:hypothetical protein